MKKLLSILGAISLTTSLSSGVVACSPGIVEENKYVSQESLRILATEFAKSAHLSDQKGYSMEYTNDNYGKSQFISDLTTNYDEKEEISQVNRIDNLQSKYFKENIDFSNIESNINLNGNVSPQESSMISSIAGIVPIIYQLFTPENGETIEGIVKLVGKVLESSGFLNSALMDYLKGILTKEAADNLKFAFDESTFINEGLSYQQSLDSSVIGLSNAFSKLVGSDKKFANTKESEISENYVEATGLFGLNLSKMIKGEVKINFDILKDWDVLGQILKFATTLVTYMNSFESFKDLTFDKIVESRNARLSSYKGMLDVKKMVINLSSALNGDGIEIKSIIASLFQAREKPRLKSGFDGLAKSIQLILSDTELPQSGISAVLNAVVKNILVIPIDNANSGSLIQELIDILVTKEGNKVLKDILEDKFLMGLIMVMVPKEMKEQIKQILDILKIFLADGDLFVSLYDGIIKGLLEEKGIIKMVNDLSTLIGDKKLQIKWSNIYELFDILENIENIDAIKLSELLIKIIGDTNAVEDIMTKLKLESDEFDEKQKELDKEMKKAYFSLNENTESTFISENLFSIKIEDVTYQVKFEKNNNFFFVKSINKIIN